jgi:hypothetical protein
MNFRSFVSYAVPLFVAAALFLATASKLVYPSSELSFSLSSLGISGFAAHFLSDAVLAVEVCLLVAVFFPQYHRQLALCVMMSGTVVFLISLIMSVRGVESGCGCAGALVHWTWGWGHVLAGACVVVVGWWWWWSMKRPAQDITRKSVTEA